MINFFEVIIFPVLFALPGVALIFVLLKIQGIFQKKETTLKKGDIFTFNLVQIVILYMSVLAAATTLFYSIYLYKVDPEINFSAVLVFSGILFLFLYGIFYISRKWEIDQKGINSWRWGRKFKELRWSEIYQIKTGPYSNAVRFYDNSNKVILKIPGDLPNVKQMKEKIEIFSQLKIEKA